MRRNLLIAGIVCCALVLAQSVSADGLLDISTNIGDFSASNSGLEMAVPFAQDVDDNLDGRPEFKFRFNVYPVGSATKLYQTPDRKTVYPYIPGCGNRDWDTDSEKMIIQNGRAHFVTNLWYGCYDSVTPQEAVKAMLYSTDITSRNGAATWTLAWPGGWIVGFDTKDVDTDGTVELIVLVGSQYAKRDDGEVVIIDPVTGTIESSTTYTVWRDKMPVPQ